MTSAEYKEARQLRGTQAEVAELLGVRQATISDRERGGEITREAWLALNMLPRKRKARRGARAVNADELELKRLRRRDAENRLP